MPSPCGANCSYTIQFEGPVFECYSSAKNYELTDPYSPSQITAEEQQIAALESFYFSYDLPPNVTSAPNASYSILKAPPLFFGGTWNFPGGVATLLGPTLNETSSQGIYTEATFNAVTLNSTNYLTPPVTITESNLTCIPSRALYTVENSYTNNIQSLRYSTGPATQLLNTRSSEFVNGTYTGISGPNYPPGDLQGDWSEKTLLWHRDCQLMAFIQNLADTFNGTYITGAIYLNQSGSIKQQNSILGGAGPASSFVPNSRINTEFQNYGLSFAQDSGSPNGGLSFNVTQEALNKMLGDLTISTMVAYGLWSETVNVSKFPSQNVYTFSHPLNLLVPYSLSLLLSLPFLVIGMVALYQNGVPAADGGFIQILSTTTGSRALQQAAAGNCLGGDKISEELKDLQIQFGELFDVQSNPGGVRRAGFGTKDEIRPLVKGEKYGYP